MKKRHTTFYHISIFIIAQLLWLMLLGIWIYWYVSNYIIFTEAEDKLAPQITYDGTNVFAFVGGLILLVAISFAMSLIFRHLNVQLRITRLYDNFIANISHELKSPLSSIQLYLETMKERSVSPEKQQQFVRLMIKDSNRLKSLIDSILEISAFEQRKDYSNYEICNVGPVIKSIIAEAKDQYNLKDDELIVNDNVDCRCVIDQNKIRIVVNNLIDNAIKYSPDQLSIKITLSCTRGNFMFELSDKGIGISDNEQKNIFNKFYRIYNREIPNVKGTGLGLYQVREIIKSHGGKILVSSLGINEGTTFKFEIPIYNSKKALLNKLLKKSKNLQN